MKEYTIPPRKPDGIVEELKKKIGKLPKEKPGALTGPDERIKKPRRGDEVPKQQWT